MAVDRGGGDAPTDADGVAATQKSIDILRVLKQRGPATLTEVAEELGNAKSTVHRHLATLERAGYVVDGRDGYRIGLLFLDYGVHAQREQPLYDAAKPKVDDLAATVGEKVWCMAEENGLGVFIYHRQGKDVYRAYTRVGYRGHLHAFSAGKAVLAYLPRERIEAIVERHGLPAYTPETITDYDALVEELDRIKDRGVAFNYGEAINGGNAIAVPILTGPETPVGSLCVAGPAHRMSGEYLESELADLLLGVANEIEVSLEYN